MNFDKYSNKLEYKSRKLYPDVYQAHKQEEHRLLELFKSDLFDELGITQNPKAEKLWVIAWDMGHSSGYSEVFNYADMFVELIN
jgi:hypothetical protein